MGALARVAVLSLALFAIGCADDSSSWEWSDCDYDEWCDQRDCHEREVCTYESCEKEWDDDFFEDEYVEECVYEKRTTEESKSHDGQLEFRRVATEGEMCRYKVEYNGWDYDESYSCNDYDDEETWRTECNLGSCRTQHCVNGDCEWT